LSGESDTARRARARRWAIPFAALLLILSVVSAEQPAPPREVSTAAAIALRHRHRDELFTKMLISPFTSLGVFPIAAHRSTRIGADESGIEVDPNTRRPMVVEILVDATGVYVTNVSSGGRLRLHRTTADGDAEPGEGTEMAGLKRLAPGEIFSIGRFLVQITGGGAGGQITLYDPDAPSRKSFTGFKWFDPAPELQIRSVLKSIAGPEKVAIATSDGHVRDYWRIGRFDFEIAGARQSLVAFAQAPKVGRGATLFIPFRDPTNGRETYATGRYLEIRYGGPNVAHLLDFNTTINPYCSYSPWYSCPIPPKENTLSAPIRAGEMAYQHAE